MAPDTGQFNNTWLPTAAAMPPAGEHVDPDGRPAFVRDQDSLVAVCVDMAPNPPESNGMDHQDHFWNSGRLPDATHRTSLAR